MSLDICKMGKWGHIEDRRLLSHASGCQGEDPLGRANLGGMLCSRLSVVMTEHQNKSTSKRKSLFWLTVLELSVPGQLTPLFSDLWQCGITPHLIAPRKEKETDTNR